jgi:RecB family exonuclease
VKETNFKLDITTLKAIRQGVQDVVTQSEIMTRANCPRKWFYRYVLRLRKRGTFNWHFIYGDLVHKLLATYYGEGFVGTTGKERPIITPEMEFPEEALPTQEDREEAELLRQIATITFRAYRMHYAQHDAGMWIRAVEKTYSVEYRGIKLEGKIDLVASPTRRDGIFIWDYKTTGTLNASMLDAWSFRFQFLFYSWLYWKATGTKPDGNYVNGIMKTLLRPKNNKKEGQESMKDYLDRVNYDVTVNREKYFYRCRMPLGTGMLERFQEEILDPHIQSFSLLANASKPVPLIDIVKSLGMAMNTDHCHLYNGFCEYLPLCKDGKLMLPEYITRENKHEELKI